MLLNLLWSNKKTEAEIEPWRKVLLDAADLIEARGAARYTLEDADGSLCIMGAVNVAVTGDAWTNGFQEPAAQEARDHFCISIGEPASWSACCEFNNHHPKSEIVAALRAAAHGN